MIFQQVLIGKSVFATQRTRNALHLSGGRTTNNSVAIGSNYKHGTTNLPNTVYRCVRARWQRIQTPRPGFEAVCASTYVSTTRTILRAVKSYCRKNERSSVRINKTNGESVGEKQEIFKINRLNALVTSEMLMDRRNWRRNGCCRVYVSTSVLRCLRADGRPP